MNQEPLGTLWRWVDPRLARSGDGGVVVSALLAGVLVDLLSEICSRPARTTRGWAAWNAAQRAADEARRQVCAS